ncbi:MAG: hypothetical protein C4342_07670, partial [Armatimonadota bacterium]
LAWLLAREFRRDEAGQVFAQLSPAEQESPRWRVARLEMLSHLQADAETVRFWRTHFAADPLSDPKVVAAVASAMSSSTVCARR